MLLSHAVVLAEARSYIAALSDSTSNIYAALEYERVLFQLDSLHGGTVPPITVVPAGDRDVLYRVASTAIRNLAEHPVDRFDVELCGAMLDAAWDRDERS